MEISLNNASLIVKGNLSDDMSDKEFYDFCQQNELFKIERDENKQIIIMPPTNTNTGRTNGKLFFELELWNRIMNRGVCFDSSTGFTLPDGSVRSPDASWLSADKWDQLSTKEKNEFSRICPDFVIELKSKTDNLQTLTKKMTKWIKNGCRLAWLINPENKTVQIFRENGTEEMIQDFDKILSGENVLPEFELNLKILD
ncbi:MAG: Uma2 family endonuclease [Ginsengibacter sp.]|jgi:Uma2 family endonuclease